MDVSVLLGNNTVPKTMRLHLGPEWHIFHALTSEDIDDVMSHCYTLCNERKLIHGELKIWILFSHGENNILLTCSALICKLMFSPLKNKIHIFMPPCNILYMHGVWGGSRILCMGGSNLRAPKARQACQPIKYRTRAVFTHQSSKDWVAETNEQINKRAIARVKQILQNLARNSRTVISSVAPKPTRSNCNLWFVV